MFPQLPTSPAVHDAVTTLRMNEVILPEYRVLYLLLAGVSLLVALRLAKRAMVPIATLVQAAAAAAGVAFAVGVAVAFVAAAVLSGH